MTLFKTNLPKPNPGDVVFIIECGCCGCFHREEYYGDCRNDNERFFSPKDAETRLGVEVEIDYLEDDDFLEEDDEY